MNRPLRIEFPGALYHVTARGNSQKAIFIDDRDRYQWLNALDRIHRRYNILLHAFCQMSNHYHLMIETVEGNLANAMRDLNAHYTQYFNRRHAVSGHVLQGRYHAVLVQKESYLLECARYVVLNPVRAGMVRLPQDWIWSSYNLTIDDAAPPRWLDTTWLLAQFGSDRTEARRAYQQFVHAGIGGANPFADIRYRIVLGDDAFTRSHGERLATEDLNPLVREQRRLAAKSLSDYENQHGSRDEAMARAYHSTSYTMIEIARHFRVNIRTVGRAVERYANAAVSWADSRKRQDAASET